ncbi:hypothetical protein [Chitinophaga solisilvae]|uniref:hypothetical protein n=1 Tax=Chitinophaga solisilvae TaxID=1233460 RepID=UPI001369E6B1|nr:hypothetical protein [Chitinophaga solisilvae]
MKHLKIGITAVALLVGLISSFTSKASRAAGSYITTIRNHRVFAPGTVCTGNQVLCGHLHTVGGKTLGPVFTNVK